MEVPFFALLLQRHTICAYSYNSVATEIVAAICLEQQNTIPPDGEGKYNGKR